MLSKKKIFIGFLLILSGVIFYVVFTRYNDIKVLLKGEIFSPAGSLKIVEGEPASTQGGPYLAKIKINPDGTAIKLGEVLSFEAIGVYSNGDEIDIGGKVTWNSNNRDVGYIDSKGIFHAKGAGKTLVYANYGGMRNDSVTISSVTLGSEEAVVEVVNSAPFSDAFAEEKPIYNQEKEIIPVYLQDRVINRGEMIKVIVLLNSLGREAEEIFYEYQLGGKDYAFYLDVPINDPNAKYIVAAKKLGILENYINLFLHPDEPISRAETLALMFEADQRGILKMAQSNAYLKYVSRSENYIAFKDVNVRSWYARYVAGAVDLNLISPNYSSFFEPDKKMHESELTSLASKIFEINR